MKGKKYLLPLLSATLLSALVSCSEAEEESTYVPQGAGPNSGASQSGTYNTSGSTGTTSTGTTTEELGDTISALEQLATFSSASAKTEVLRHAGYSESNIEGYTYEVVGQGSLVEYHISFWMGIVKYDYVVSGTDGTILTFKTEFNNEGYSSTVVDTSTEVDSNVFVVQDGHVTRDQAKAIVAKDAGVSTSAMMNFEIKNRTTGAVNEYEMTFSVGNIEYYYTILPTTGTITLARKTEPEPEPEIEIPEVMMPTVTPSTGSSGSSSSSSSSGSSSSSNATTTTTPDITPATPEPSVEETTPVLPDSTVQSSSSSSSAMVEDFSGAQSSTASSSTATSGAMTSTSAAMISSNDAKNIAFAQAGVSETGVTSLSILEAKDGTGAVVAYNVSFISGGGSHYYTVSATTGAVR